MSAYQRGESSTEAYLVRIISALAQQNGGTLRIKGELIDAVGEPTALLKSWDTKSQELVIQVSMGTFTEVFRVIPEKKPTAEVIATAQPQTPNGEAKRELPKHGNTLDNDKLADLERDMRLRSVKHLVAEELRRRQRSAEGGN